MTNTQIPQIKASLGVALLAATVLTGCGQQPFVATASIEALNAPGIVSIPAKADILLVEDDTGSMNEIYPQISGAMPGVLSGLEAKGWDYHFATIPLTTYRSLNGSGRVSASHYDGNWGSSWVAPFPGAVQYGPETVSSGVFAFPQSYNAYLHPGDILNTNGTEWGLDNIANSLLNMQADGTNFLRPDAMLVVLVVGNGNDTSRVNYCPRSGDGLLVPCDNVTTIQCSNFSQWGATGQTCASGALSLNYYQQLIASLKPTSAMIRFYAAVSSQRISNSSCQGSNADIGSRYQAMASAFGGKSYDICSGQGAVTSALDSLSNDLQSVRLSLQTRYLPISQEPNLSTVIVTRNDGVIIPQSASNGWTYAGYISNGYQIDYPVAMNQFSGYAIELHGVYKLVGSQTAQVTYTPKGLQNTH